MPVPTHGPQCRTLFCRQSSCGYCGQEVFHWACTCGSNVLFDELDKPWPKHECTDASASKPGVEKSVSTYTYGVLSVVCARCGKSVRKRDLDAHNYWTHRIGKKPKPEPYPNFATEPATRVAAPLRRVGYTGAGKPMVACPQCGAKVLQKNLRKHLTKKCPKAKQ